MIAPTTQLIVRLNAVMSRISGHSTKSCVSLIIMITFFYNKKCNLLKIYHKALNNRDPARLGRLTVHEHTHTHTHTLNHLTCMYVQVCTYIHTYIHMHTYIKYIIVKWDHVTICPQTIMKTY